MPRPLQVPALQCRRPCDHQPHPQHPMERLRQNRTPEERLGRPDARLERRAPQRRLSSASAAPSVSSPSVSPLTRSPTRWRRSCCRATQSSLYIHTRARVEAHRPCGCGSLGSPPSGTAPTLNYRPLEVAGIGVPPRRGIPSRWPGSPPAVDPPANPSPHPADNRHWSICPWPSLSNQSVLATIGRPSRNGEHL